MNEKIKLLAIKAQNNGDSIHYYDPVFAEKFAELIIQEFAYECIDVTNQGERIQWIAKKWGISI